MTINLSLFAINILSTYESLLYLYFYIFLMIIYIQIRYGKKEIINDQSYLNNDFTWLMKKFINKEYLIVIIWK